MTISEEAKHVSDRCFTEMSQCVTGNGEWASARCIGADIIQSALDRAYNQGLDDAAKIIEPEYEFEVFAKRRKKYAENILALKRGQP